MQTRSTVGVGLCGLVPLVGVLAVGGCNKNKPDTSGPTTGLGTSMSGERPTDLKVPKVDTSLCQADRAGARIVAYDLNHDERADAWKIYQASETGGVKSEILTCKQVDLDHDAQSRKDYVVQYDTQGNILLEEIDYDFDGKFDARRHFDKQTKKLVMVERNTNFDERPDLWEEFTADEKVSRVLRDRNDDGKPDYWELFDAAGKLEAILYDEDFDGKVDKREDAIVTPPAAAPTATPPVTGDTPVVPPTDDAASPAQ